MNLNFIVSDKSGGIKKISIRVKEAVYQPNQVNIWGFKVDGKRFERGYMDNTGLHAWDKKGYENVYYHNNIWGYTLIGR